MYEKFLRLAALGLLSAILSFGQTQGTIQGVVTDNSGAVIPGAQVQVANLETGVSSEVSTNEAGYYAVPALNPGIYKITASADGFAPQERPQLRLEVGMAARVDFNLNVGSVVEVVEVSAASQILQTEQTDVGQVIDSKRILEMPLNGRNYLQLAQFTVGVLPSRTLGKGTRQDGERGGEGGFRAMGLNVAQNNILLDGNDNSSRNSGGALGFQSQAVKPPVDAVSEFKVVTNNMSAEYGYRAGAKVLVSTKSGTNQFHGSLYEFLRNEKLDGTNFFANRAGAKKPTYRQNQYGGTIGGPIVKNKTFFFFSYQGTRIRLGQSFISTVPSLDVLNGDFSQQPRSGATFMTR
ncbi:MAG: carboxypeptidase regulatory-like domain-containing protein [Bryobacterales bacterium]